MACSAFAFFCPKPVARAGCGMAGNRAEKKAEKSQLV
jgi:hypothetical protein